MANGYDKFFKEARKASGLDREPGFKLTPDKKPGAHRSNHSPEDRLRQELSLRIRQKKAKALRKRAKFPVGPAIAMVAILVLAGVGYHKADSIDDLLSRIEISAFGEASAAETKPAAPAKPAAKPDAPKAKTADAKPVEKPHEAAEPAPEKKTAAGYSAEEVSFFSKLNERKKELDQREGDLNKLEEELQKRKAELDDKLKSLENTRAEISKTLKTRVATDQKKVDKLVDFYSTMKPQQAAKVIETLNEDLAVELLDKMKKKNAAEVLNLMNAKKARRLSELLTGYERTTASVEAEEPADLPAQDPKPEPAKAEKKK